MKRKFALGFGAVVLLFWPSLVLAQRGVPQTRIREAIDESRRKVLSGNTHPLARTQFDRGMAPPDLPMERMMLVLTRSAEQQANLDLLLAELADPASSHFHRWLTPEQFGEQFGASDQDIQTVTTWLAGQGFRVEQPMKGKSILEFSGTAGQVANTFHTRIHKYLVDGTEHWANASDPEIPSALAPVVAGVVTMHNFTKQPEFEDPGIIHRSDGLLSGPAFTSSSGAHALSPSDYATIYNINPVYQSGINGSGVTIAVVARSNLNLSDITSFRSLFGLPANPPQIVVNGIDPGDRGGGEETEVVLDTSWAGAVAPNATVKVVVSRSTNSADGVDLSEAYIINNNLADVMTESFGSCEASYTATQAAAASSLAAQAAAQGITYLVATGDSGASGCSSPSSATSSGTISVNTLAANPYVIAVGGTQLNDSAGSYWGASNSSTRASALSYIPENAWNDSCSVAQCGASGAGLWATGGGASVFYSKPTWQTGVPGIPNDGARDVPDVSLTAAGHDPYLVCIRSSCASSTPAFAGIAGTSASAPAFAGIMALIVQRAGSRQGQANVTLYRLAASQNMALCNGSLPGGVSQGCVFNDITAGNNAVPGQANYGTLQASYQTGVGYDLVTGLGSVNVANLVNSWALGNVTIGGNPALTASASDLDFGSVPIGMSSAQTLTLSNTGTANLAISGISIGGDNSGVFTQTNNCGGIVGPGGTCTITVSFLPTAIGEFTANLTVTDNAAGSPQSIPLIGSGTGTSTLTFSSSSVDFGSRKLQLRSETRTLQVVNSTPQSVSISGVSVTGANLNDFSIASACGTTLRSGQSCSVNVVFTPQLTGSRSASIVVASSLPNSPETIPISGSGALAGAFEIVNSVSGKVLDIQAGSGGNGALIAQNTVNGQAQQQWIFYPLDNGYYYILNSGTGKVLDLRGYSPANGALVQQWDYLGGPNQEWQMVPIDDVHYRIVNRVSGKVLDMPGGSSLSGTTIQQWDANGAPQQSWIFVPSDTYRVVSRNSGIVLDLPGGSPNSGTLVQQFSPNGGNQQQWQFVPTGGGYYAILNRQSGKVLDITAGSPNNGATIQQYDFLNGPNQQWRLDLVNATSYRIVSRGTGKVLDVVGASTANGAGIQQWDYLGGANQLWQVSPVALYAIVGRLSGDALEVPAANSADGTNVQQAPRTNSQQQRWQPLPLSGGYLAIVNDATGKVLDVTAASTADGALIQQYQFLGGPNQQWQSLALSGGFSALLNRGSGKALDVVGASTSAGALLQQYIFLGGGNQQWSLVPITQ